MSLPIIAVVGTFDTKGVEHNFLLEAVKQRGLKTLSMNVGTKSRPVSATDIDLYPELQSFAAGEKGYDRDAAIAWMADRARQVLSEQHAKIGIAGMISAGGGTGTHLCAKIMRALPLGVPKVMVSTVAAHDMSHIVGTKDITMIHSVVDILGVNSISGRIFDQAAAAVCAMAQSRWQQSQTRPRIALTFFGFITQAAEQIHRGLEHMGYEVIAFHANGTGGMAMEELAAEGYFDGILDLATHELADALLDGYCGGIGPRRLMPVDGHKIPRLVVPGGLDCAVLEFTRQNVPQAYQDRPIFFYDFRSAIRLNQTESDHIAMQLAEKLNQEPAGIRILNPVYGWSAADIKDGPLYDPEMNRRLMAELRRHLDNRVTILDADFHINDAGFADLACRTMDEMIRQKNYFRLTRV